MLGMSKKMIFILFISSVLLWMFSSVIQVVNRGLGGTLGNLLSPSCYLTGYPFADCVSEYQQVYAFGIIILNILSWFALLVLILLFFNKFRKA